MKILVIGSGGREHALVWKIAQSTRVKKIYCAPGNPGTSEIAENVPIQINELDKLIRFGKKKKINLTIVGPEAPLIDGIVDLFKKNNLQIIGPSKKAAQIEGSKVFAKKLMLKYKIPSADFAVFDDYTFAQSYITNQKYPLVIKADGQCAGKGVAVCKNVHEAQIFLKSLMKDRIFGISANKVIIEECLVGQEVSFMLASDGMSFVPFLPSQDHKRVNENDVGANTGGMGAYTPLPFLDKRLVKRIESEIVEPVLNALKKEGVTYEGILYPGLILTKNGPKVLEFNCRLGDPETQALMFMLKSDIVELFQAIIDKNLKDFKLQWFDGSAVCVVLTAKGYPGEIEKGKIINGLSKNITAFHSGTKFVSNKFVTNGGRVLGIAARGKNLKDAINNVYKQIGKNGVHFSGMHYRKDIGQKGLTYKN